MTIETLLPPNATPQERALEQAMLPGEDVRAGIELIRTAKENPPDDWLYFLIWEFGLEELLPYLPDPRVALERGLVWQRIRGTPNSMRLAHSWLGLTAGIEEETPGGAHWFEYQLALDHVPLPEELRNIVGLARLSQPVRSRLSRIYHGLDYRRGRWDQFSWSDGSLYCADSGVYDPDLDVNLSFARRSSSYCEVADPVAYSAHSRETGCIVQYEDRAIYSFGKYDDLPVKNYRAVAQPAAGIIGQGVGRNLLVADGVHFANGSRRANGIREEQPQPPANHYTRDFTTETAGWGMVPWDNRTWTGV